MQKLMRTPLRVMLGDKHLENVTFFEYKEDKLFIEFFPLDFKHSNEIFDIRLNQPFVYIEDSKTNQEIKFIHHGIHDRRINLDKVITCTIIFNVTKVEFNVTDTEKE